MPFLNFIPWCEAQLKTSLRASMFSPVALTAWSKVFRIDCEKGVYFLKKNPESFAQEGLILSTLHNTPAREYLPEIVGFDNDTNLVLTKHAGINICTEMKHDFDLSKLLHTIDAYVTIQSSVNIEDIRKAGARVMGSSILFEYVQDTVKHLYTPRFVKTEGSIPLQYLSTSVARCRPLFEQFVELSIPDMLEHSDFHLGNVLYNGSKPLIIDYSEVTIANPLFSLSSLMSSIERRLDIHPTHLHYKELVRHYLEELAERTGITVIHLEKLKKISDVLYPFYYIAVMAHIVERHHKHNNRPYYQPRLDRSIQQVIFTSQNLLDYSHT